MFRDFMPAEAGRVIQGQNQFHKYTFPAPEGYDSSERRRLSTSVTRSTKPTRLPGGERTSSKTLTPSCVMNVSTWNGSTHCRMRRISGSLAWSPQRQRRNSTRAEDLPRFASPYTTKVDRFAPIRLTMAALITRTIYSPEATDLWDRRRALRKRARFANFGK